MNFHFDKNSPFYYLGNRSYFVVYDNEFRKDHVIFDGPPNDWAADRGATHTLFCGEGPGQGTRPAKLLKTVAYIGIDEDDGGQIVWQKWGLIPSKTISCPAVIPLL